MYKKVFLTILILIVMYVAVSFSGNLYTEHQMGMKNKICDGVSFVGAPYLLTELVEIFNSSIFNFGIIDSTPPLTCIGSVRSDYSGAPKL